MEDVCILLWHSTWICKYYLDELHRYDVKERGLKLTDECLQENQPIPYFWNLSYCNLYFNLAILRKSYQLCNRNPKLRKGTRTSPVSLCNDGSPLLRRPNNTWAHCRRPVSLMSVTVCENIWFIITQFCSILSLIWNIYYKVLWHVDPLLGNGQ
jgi:hypothetical protein